jgi:hypothetical protein
MNENSNKRGRKPTQTLPLEEEAKKFLQAKEVRIELEKPLTNREYFAGCAMTALLISNQGRRVSPAEIKREAYSWADYFMKGD